MRARQRSRSDVCSVELERPQTERWNARRGLTHPNHFTERRAVMKPTNSPEPDPCSLWAGHPELYQEQAALAAIESGLRFWPWCWIYTNCGNDLCIAGEHLVIYSPAKLKYPNGICVYCGGIAGTRDHLIPRPMSGETARRNVLTVPSCGECNSLIGSRPIFSITERREYAHAALRKKHAKVLRRIDYSSADIKEFGPGLRPSIVAGIEEKRRLERRLLWPADAAFDARALEKSGIEDPYVLGLLKHVETNTNQIKRKAA